MPVPPSPQNSASSLASSSPQPAYTTYSARQSDLQAQYDAAARRAQRLQQAIVAVLIAAVAAIYFALHDNATSWPILISFAIAVLLTHGYLRVRRLRDRLYRLLHHYELALGRVTGTQTQSEYTGEEFRTGILISADVPLFAQHEWTHVVDPVRHGRSTDPMPQKFLDDQWLAVIMHETGHNLGMQHNFIGSRA